MFTVCLCICTDMGVGMGLYGAPTFITTSDLISTVTPEKRTEERREKLDGQDGQSVESTIRAGDL